MKIRIFSIMLAVMLLTGCSSFDHKKYVTSLLDNTYKGKFEEYCKITEISEAEAKKEHEDFISSGANLFDSSGLTQFDPTQKEALLELTRKMYGETSYVVSRSEKQTKEKYMVTVKVKPIENFKNMSDKLRAFGEDFGKQLVSEEFQKLSQQEVQVRLVSGFIKVLEDNTQTIEFGAEKAYEVAVIYNGDAKKWEPNADDLKRINDNVIAFE